VPVQYYLFPLRNSAHLMKPADVTHVFSNMEFLYERVLNYRLTHDDVV
jgi:hypothetical protein